MINPMLAVLTLMPDKALSVIYPVFVAISVVAMAVSAAYSMVLINAAIAALTSIIVMAMAGWRPQYQDLSTDARVVQLIELTIGVFAWGGASMLAMYYLTPLSWYHAYQYGLIFGVAACCALWLKRLLQRHGAMAMAGWLPLVLLGLAGAQIILGAVGIGHLISSGKLFHIRADWAANHVFAAGAVLILVIGVVTIPHLRRLISRVQ